MTTSTIDDVQQTTGAWISRWLFGKPSHARGPISPARGKSTGHDLPDEAGIREFVQSLTAQGRYVFVLHKAARENLDASCAAMARQALEDRMAFVTEGAVPIVVPEGRIEMRPVRAFFMDRHAVSNALYAKFVVGGGYEDLELWPSEVLPSLMRFTDRTGRPGPAGWTKNNCPPGLESHPVVGICWHEAAAYARWAGKRLPTAAEWRKAAGWPDRLQGGDCTQYPWGDLFNPSHANLWTAGLGKTAPVDSFPGGDTPSGIHQLCGNVWEWVEDALDAIPCDQDELFHVWKPMRRILGGSFDTYFPAEAASSFMTGHGELGRRHNIGFRCVVSHEDLVTEDFLNTTGEVP